MPAAEGRDPVGALVKLLFGECAIDTARRELTRAGRQVPLEPKVFDFLVLLATHRDRVVTRDELIDTLWNGRFISEAALATCVKAARRAIGDEGVTQSVIRTVRKVGFRLVSPVSEIIDPAEPVHARPTAPPPDRADIAPPALIDSDTQLQLPDQPSIAILPFEPVSAADPGGLIALGLARDITTELGRQRWLFVIARGSSARFAPHQVHEIGAMLAVRYVVQGSVIAHGGRARLDIALVDAVDQRELWAEVFDRDTSDFPAVPKEVTGSIVANIQAAIEASERRRALRMPFANLDAWSAYHRGGWHLDRHTQEDYDLAEASFLRAIELDPLSPHAVAGLSAVYRQRAFLRLTSDRDRAASNAVEFALRSLSLDGQDSQAHWAMGRALMLNGDVESALRSFETATSLNPSFAMGLYSLGFSQAMAGLGEHSDVALTRSRRLSPVDPMRFAMFATHAFNAIGAGDLALAAEYARVAAAQPNAHYHIVAIAALCSALHGQEADAERYARRLRALRPEYRTTDFFMAFPFRDPRQVAAAQEGLRRFGLR